MFGTKVSGSIHSEYDTSSSSFHLNSFVNSSSTSLSITETDITACIDSDIFFENCAQVRECGDVGHLLDDSVNEIPLARHADISDGSVK